MSRTREIPCLARIDPEAVEVLTAALATADCTGPLIATSLSVTELGHMSPSVLVVDVDRLDVDPLEMLRMLRFVLPTCMIGVYTAGFDEAWALRCHMAGANCILSKESDTVALGSGLRQALHSGCFTDSHFKRVVGI